MTAILRALVGPLTATMLLMLGIGLLGTLVPLRLADAGVSTTAIGVVSSGYFLGLIVGALTGQRTIAAVGHIRAFASFTALMAAATLLHPFAVAPMPWFALRLIEGVCMSGLSMCVESWLNQSSPDQLRARVFAVYMVIFYLAQGGGQALLTIPDESGFGLFAITAVLLSLAALPVAAAPVMAPRRPRKRPIAVLGGLRASPSAAAGALASGLALGAFYSLAPVFARGVGMDLSATAAFMGAAIAGGVLLQYPLGTASDRIDRRTVLAASGAGLALIAAGLVVSSAVAPAWLPWLAPLLGGFLFAVYPLSAAQANDRIGPEQRIAVAGSLLLAYGVGATLGPPLAALLIDATGPAGVFVFIAGVGVVLSGVALARKGIREPASDGEKQSYQAVPRIDAPPADCARG